MPARQFGRKIGPTGRKRDDFHVYALRHPREEGRRELIKPHKGTTALLAYGQAGVREAKQSVHRQFPRKWVHFKVYNETRMMRNVAKRRKK